MSLIPAVALTVGGVVSSPAIDVSKANEVGFLVTVEAPRDEFCLQVRVESQDGSLWRPEQTLRLSSGSIALYQLTSSTEVVRLTLIALCGSATVEADLTERPAPTKPPNFDLLSNSLVYVDENSEVAELAPPAGPNLYLGTDASGNFGYHPLPAGAGALFAWNEVPAGTIDGINDTFLLAHIPAPPQSLQLHLNGIGMTAGIDFTLTSGQIKYHPDQIPAVGDFHKATYQHA